MFNHLIVLTLVSSVIYVVGTALVGRISIAKRINVYFRIALLGFTTLPLFLGSRYILSGYFLPFMFYDTITHLSLGALFAQFICLPDRALTLRILVEIYEKGNQGLEIEELNSKFSLVEMIQSRLKQMENGGVLSVSDDGAIKLRKRGQGIGKMILRGRRFFAISSAN